MNPTDPTGINITGTSDLAPLADQAQMILDLFPDTKKVGALYCSAEANSQYQVDGVKEALEKKGVTAHSIHLLTQTTLQLLLKKLQANQTLFTFLQITQQLITAV